MSLKPIRHGSLFLAGSAFLIAGVNGQEPVRVRARAFDIVYSVNDEALPLNAIHLWYSADHGASWHESGFDEDRQSPITFTAPQEGLYGFFLVVANSMGPSSMVPTRGTEAQLWAFVDFTPPIVQLHPVRQSTMLGQRVLQIRWTAIDSHFGSRPVGIAYQRLPDETWHSVTRDPLANSGRFDWRLPEDLSGPVSVRLSVTDQGGHRVNSERQVIEIPPAPVEHPTHAAQPATLGSGTATSTVGRARLGPTQVNERAARLFSEALALRRRGEFRQGIAHLREAVKLNPRWAEAFAEMADMLYRIGDVDRALSAYKLALREQPTLRSAHRGAAIAYQQINDHTSAARHLRTILRSSPNDAEVWMNLGDIAVYQGDEVLARACYTRATRTDSSATQVIADARKRLSLMAEVSRKYRQTGQ